MLTPDTPPSPQPILPEWRIEPGLTDYPRALATMEARAAAIADGVAGELVWLVEHPPLYTAGTSADPAELLDPRFPVYPAGRGGRYTYHGPGQRVGYVMLNLAQRGRDVRCFVHAVEQWVIRALARLEVEAFSVPERIGIWTATGGRRRRSAPSVFACGAGSPSTAFRSTCLRTSPTSAGSCRAAFPNSQ